MTLTQMATPMVRILLGALLLSLASAAGAAGQEGEDRLRMIQGLLADAGYDTAAVAFDTAPVLQNPRVIQQALTEYYPPDLKSQGIGGKIEVFLRIDREGRVEDGFVITSSGEMALDVAALAVTQGMEFSPGLKDDEPVALWVAMWVTFEVRETGQM